MNFSILDLKRLLAGALAVLVLMGAAPVAIAAADPSASAHVEMALGEEIGALPAESYQSSANAGISGSMYSCLNTRQKACYNALQSITFDQIRNAVNIDGIRAVYVNVSGINGVSIDGSIRDHTFYPAGQAAQQVYNSIYNDMGAAVIALRYDRPDLLWLDGTITYGVFYSSAWGASKVQVSNVYYGFELPYGGQEEAMRTEMMQEAQKVADEAARQPDTYSKLKVAHDLLAQRSSYNHVRPTEKEEILSHSAYSGLIGGDIYDPVCDGYSKAMKLVCDLLDIPCVCVSSATHMWNNVLMDDGLWYNLDLTWDDGQDRLGVYTYFLIGSKTRAQGQIFDQQESHVEWDAYKAENITVPGKIYPTKSREAYVYIGQDYPQPTFPDVKRDAWYFDNVELVAGLGYFSGDAKGNFLPNKTITRAEFVKAVANVQGIDLTPYQGVESFPDVPTRAWYAPVVAWAKETGAMQGSGGKFRPGDPITRQEMCLVLCNAFDLDAGGAGVADFPDDAVIAGWARDAVYICAAVGLVKGDDKGSFHPRNNTKRSEAAALFARYAQYTGAVE